MQYINRDPYPSGSYGNLQSNFVEGKLGVPDELISSYLEAKGFVILTIENDIVTSLTINQTAYDAYQAWCEKEEQAAWIALKSYEPNEYVVIDENLYKVLLPIYAGSRFTIGTNIESTTIEQEIYGIKLGE